MNAKVKGNKYKEVRKEGKRSTNGGNNAVEREAD